MDLDIPPPTPSRHARTPSAIIRRQPLQRSTTKGPLGLDDPLEAAPSASSPSIASTRSSTPLNEHSIVSEALGTSTTRLSANRSPPARSRTDTSRSVPIPPSSKDFGFLLRQDIYHPLSELVRLSLGHLSHSPTTTDTTTQSLAPPFRSLPLPSISSSTPTALVASLLGAGRFHSAANECARLLTTSVSPTNHPLIFSLFYTRLACLQLLSLTALAAEESKALQDLNNPFYLSTPPDAATPPRNLIPYHLRLLAIRLQSIAFNDPRRSITGLYDLAREARTAASKTLSTFTEDERSLWRARLRDIGVHVANALIETGDLEGAARHLQTLKVQRARAGGGRDEVELEMKMKMRLALVYLRLGDVDAARKCFTVPAAEQENEEEEGKAEEGGAMSPSPLAAQIVAALCATTSPSSSSAAVDAVNAVDAWTAALSTLQPQTHLKSNLAVSLIYASRIAEARSVLEELVSQNRGGDAGGGGVDSGVLFNLCTVYELVTDRAKEEKVALAERVACGGGVVEKQEQQQGREVVGERVVGDFKL